jgi:hypothetical protein
MMEKKLRKYINRKFFLYPKTEKIIEVREELYSIMLDQYSDCLAAGISQEQSYKKAIEMTLDYKSAVKEVETGSSMGALKKNLISTASFSTFYFLTLTAIFLFVSIVVLNSFEKTWLVPVAGAFIYLLYAAINGYQYANLFNFDAWKRWGIAIIYATLVPLLYVLPSMYLWVVKGKNIWGYSWLIVIVLAFLYIVTDYIANRKLISSLERDLRLMAAGLILTTFLYLAVSVRFNLWGSAWIIFVLYLALVSLAFYIGENTGPPKSNRGD